jgi:hypothetical protein
MRRVLHRLRGRLGGAGVALVAASVLIATHPQAPAVAGGRTKQWVRVIAPGLTLTRIVEPKAPRRIYVLTVDPREDLTLDVALAQDRLGAIERTSSMAARHGALAAVNGDFGSSSGRPAHPYAEDGELVQTSRVLGTLLTIADDETVRIVQPRVSAEVLEADTGERWAISRWNQGPPALGELAAFTDVGGSEESPPAFACNARLVPAGAPRVEDSAVSLAHTVDRVECDGDGMAVAGGLVLSAQPGTEEAVFLRSLTPGEALTVSWSVGSPRALDAIGGVPMLVADGRIVLGPCTTSFCRRHPRTAAGVTADGRVLLVAVDGRQPKWSVGMSLGELARFMLRLGARWAVNLDGGGSTTVWVQGEVVNRPSGGSERAVTNALLVLPGPDPGEARLAW